MKPPGLIYEGRIHFLDSAFPFCE